MFIFTAKVSKWKCAAIALMVIAIIALVITLFSNADTDAKNNQTQLQQTTPEQVESNEDRIAYLASFGWEVEANPIETQEVKIPETFPEVLEKYNELQKEQGYDLTQYAGKQVKRYVYEVTNYPDTNDQYYATLLVYKDAVIGADITNASQTGTMHGLQMPKS